MVQVTVSRSGQLERTETDVVQRFIVDTERLVRIFHQLMNGQSGVIRFDYSIGDLCTEK